MKCDGAFSRAVAALIRLGDHNRESARRFLSRCTLEEARSLAGCEDANDFDAIVERILDRMEATT